MDEDMNKLSQSRNKYNGKLVSSKQPESPVGSKEGSSGDDQQGQDRQVKGLEHCEESSSD